MNAPVRSAQERRWIRLKRMIVRGFRRHTCLLLDGEWLAKHDVTLTECGRLSEWIAGCCESNMNLNALLRDIR